VFFLLISCTVLWRCCISCHLGRFASVEQEWSAVDRRWRCRSWFSASASNDRRHHIIRRPPAYHHKDLAGSFQQSCSGLLWFTLYLHPFTIYPYYLDNSPSSESISVPLSLRYRDCSGLKVCMLQIFKLKWTEIVECCVIEWCKIH